MVIFFNKAVAMLRECAFYLTLVGSVSSLHSSPHLSELLKTLHARATPQSAISFFTYRTEKTVRSLGPAQCEHQTPEQVYEALSEELLNDVELLLGSGESKSVTAQLALQELQSLIRRHSLYFFV